MDSPQLDSRSAEEILAQATNLAQNVYLTGLWNGFADPGDPAFQLMRVFSRLMEILLERLNKVPDKNFLAFLDMVGVEPSPGAPASVPMTFLPSAKAPQGGLIPAGTQTATTQTDGADAQVFETRQSIYATASKLTAIVNLLPGSDQFSVLPAPVLPPKLDPAGSSTIVPEWVTLSDGAPGLSEVPHVMYLGSTTLFGRKETLNVTLKLTVVGGDASLLSAANLVWTKLDKTAKTWVPLAPGYSLGIGGEVQVMFGAFANADKSTIAGVEDFWLACAFVGPMPAPTDQPQLGAIVGSLAPSAPGSSEAPQKAFSGATAVDLSRPFKPFGDRPRFGDAFYLTSPHALAPEVQSVTLTVELKPYLDTDLQAIFGGLTATTAPLVKVKTVVEWQYLASDGTWKNLSTFEHHLDASVPPTTITRTLSRNGVDISGPTGQDGSLFGRKDAPSASFTFFRPADMVSGKVNGEEGFWIRALLTSDDPYGKEAFLVPGVSLTAVGSTLVPPVIKSASLSFTYKNSFIPVDHVVTENNFAQVDQNQGDPAPHLPLQPFFALSQAPLFGSATAAFAASDGLYLGFDQPFGDVYISLYIKMRDIFPSVDQPAEQGDPLVAWEYLAGGPLWKPLDVQDATDDLTSSGTVSFLGPSDFLAASLFGAPAVAGATPLYWLRARLASGSYDYPPAVQGIFPNTVISDNRFTFRGEVVVGSGSGEPNQRLTLLKAPVLSGELWVREPEPPPQAELDELVAELRADAGGPDAGSPVETADDVLEIRTSPAPANTNVTNSAPAREVWVRWRRVPNFLGSGPRSRHYALDPLTGVLLLGDGKQQGLLPTVAKDNLVIRNYRTGGGEAASRVAVPLAVKELKSSLPYVEKVFNVEAATGGSDPWTLEEIFQFGPQLLKNKGRAVSAEDFEWMVLQRFSQVARAKCLSTRAPGPTGLVMKPGAVTVVVVPKSPDRVPRPSSALLRQIADFLTEQCLGSIVADVYALGPGFTTVTVKAQIRARDPRESSEVERRATKALEDFFHPLTGGEDGRGWLFGRDVQLSEVFAVLQRVDGVDYVASAEFVGAPGVSTLPIGENDLCASGSHTIEMI